jgi:spore coat polysaccharide biosynthesis protein SpsF (cytidylyltransferase family)
MKMDSKEFYMEVHEELVGEYMNDNPKVSWLEAYEATADKAYDVSVDRLLDYGDYMSDVIAGK